MLELFDQSGNIVRLDKELGRGGEGSVYSIASLNQLPLVAKVYHAPVDHEKSAKLSTMVVGGTPQLMKLAAWPTTTLHKSSKGPVCGFLMPRAAGKPVHELYSPKSRVKEFPEAGWAFLIHAAGNVARAVATVHEHHHVIGDINQNTFFVSEKATAMLIDCDSFQISSRDRHFLCEVGMDIFTPPELQDKRFKDVIRTQNHDSFGLAVVIFYLLFMGKHPYQGRYLGPEQKALKELISENRFAFGDNISSRRMASPLGALPLNFVSQPVANLFERAFSQPKNGLDTRPKPQEWISHLANLSRNLRVCITDATHQYPKALNSCPWCDMEGKSQVRLFGVSSSRSTHADFDLDNVWSIINSVQLPIIQNCPLPHHLNVKPDEKFVEAGRQIRRSIGLAMFRRDVRELRRNAKQVYESAKAEYDLVVARWSKEVIVNPFIDRRLEFAQVKQKFQDLEGDKLRRLQELTNATRERKLNEYLRTFQLTNTRITQVGPTRASRLRTAGVLTAADINQRTVSVVNHWEAEANLLEWRKQLENKFIFNANKDLNSADVAAIHNNVMRHQEPLKAILIGGKVTLEKIAAEILQRQLIILPIAQRAASALAQAEVNHKCF